MTQSISAPSFRDWLSQRTNSELATLLGNRPDALVPLPPSFVSLATRLSLRTSLARALADCNAQQLAVLEEIARRGGELEEVADPNPQVTRELKARGLVFGEVMIPRELMPALPTRWSLLDQLTVDPQAIADLPADEAHIVRTLDTSGGLGTSRDADPAADPLRPIPRLIAKGLLQRVDSSTVRLPQAIHRALHGLYPEAIPLQPTGRMGDAPMEGSAEADQAGAAAGLEVVRGISRVLEEIGPRPIELLKDKTVGVRPLQALAKRLDLRPEEVRRLSELAHAARLVSRGEPHGYEGNFLALTEEGAQWADLSLADQWRRILEAWIYSPWNPQAPGRTLSPDARSTSVPQLRERILQIFLHARVPLDSAQFHEELRFAAPLVSSHTAVATIEALVHEAEWIGAVAKGQATRVLIEGPAAAAALTPEPVDHFLIQADMTILVPGPLVPSAHRTLVSMADLESPGLASVYRLSEESIRRAMDSGLSAPEILAFLKERGDVPQSVAYLVEDSAKRHGTLRSGVALSYLRSEDPALLELAVRSLSELRRLAPTVAVSDLHVGELLEKLRAHGLSPAAEDATGATLNATAQPALVPTPAPKKPRPHPADPQRAIAALRASASQPSPTQPEAAELDILQAAARGRRTVLITYADKAGNPRKREITPLSVSGGQVDGTSADGATIRFPLHRITSVKLT